MSAGDELPNDILEAVRYLREMKDKAYLSRQERENINRAKLRIAYWSCRTENVAATRENLTYILGGDAADIMSAYDKYLERSDGKGRDGKGRQGDTGEFWGGGS